MPSIQLSVIVAAYNEAAVIERNIERMVQELELRQDVRWELLLVNDGSKDETGALMDAAAAKHPQVFAHHHRRNFGQGRAIRTGVDAAQGEVLVTLDADLSYGPDYIWKLYDALEETSADIALASAYAKGGGVANVPYYRYFLSRWGNRYLSMMTPYDISTLTCVVRAYRVEVFDQLYLTANGMELQIEIMMKAAMLGLRVAEIPAHMRWAPAKKDAPKKRVSKMRIFNSIQMYLKLGWLTRPSKLFSLFGLLLCLVSLYMFAWQGFRFVQFFVGQLGQGAGVSLAASVALKDLFLQYAYSIAFAGMLMFFGLIVILFSLQFLQNKYHFDETYQILQEIMKSQRRNAQP